MNPNDQLHQQALDALADRKPSQTEQDAIDGANNYNQRRKEATARFGEVASQIWEKLEAGEAVGGVSTKEAWCSVVGIKIRWAQKAIHRYRVSVGRTEDALPASQSLLTAYPDDISFHKGKLIAYIGIEKRNTYVLHDVSGNIEIYIACELKQRREGLVALGEKVKDTLKQLRLWTKEFAGEWKEAVANYVASLPSSKVTLVVKDCEQAQAAVTSQSSLLIP
jgi:hypothetical protein